MYEWNYRKQLLRIQAGGEGGWEDVQEDIFSTEFLLTRPLMQAISSPEPVVLLIDEIDKTDQEFEAMLLELLSDFQITIPELGQVAATTMPIVVLTSNDSRELTEALKRRCLYLWLDYPGVEREMEIVRLHAPELPRDAGPAAGRGDRDGASPRPEEAALDRRVDRLGADAAADGRRGHRPRDLRPLDVDHRQAPHRHRPGRRAGRDETARAQPRRAEPDAGLALRAQGRRRAAGAGGEAARLLRGAAQRGRGGRDLGDPRRLRRAGAGRLDLARGLPRGAGGDDRQVPGRPPRLRAALRPLLLPRRRGRGGRSAGSPSAARAAGRGRRRSGRAAERIDIDELREQIREAMAGRRRGRGCATWRGWRSPPSAAARARAWSASTCSGSAAPWA